MNCNRRRQDAAGVLWCDVERSILGIEEVWEAGLQSLVDQKVYNLKPLYTSNEYYMFKHPHHPHVLACLSVRARIERAQATALSGYSCGP